jgi:hypothetical protein
MQTAYNTNPSVAYAGMPYDSGVKDIISRIAATRQLEEIVVDSATNSATYQAIINGTTFEYTADGTATVTEIRDGLKAEIDAGAEPVSTESVSTNTLLIESDSYTTSFTITLGGTGVADMTLTALVPQGQPVPFGAVVVEDERVEADSLSGKREGCRLPRLATDFSNRKMLGVAMADTSMVTNSSEPYGGYEANETVPVLRRGRIWMEVEDIANVAVGGLVYVRHVATGTEKLGAIRAADDGSDTEVLDAQQAQFTGQKNTSLNLAVVEWNMP